MRSSSSVTSCGVPNVVMVEKNRSSTSPLRKIVVSNGVAVLPIVVHHADDGWIAVGIVQTHQVHAATNN